MKITYKDKVALTDDETIPSENKVTAEDMNEIKKAVNLNDENIQENTDNVKLLKQENEILKETINNVIPSVGDSGENVTLNGTAEARFKKFVLGGNSWQETRSGKNIFDNRENLTNTTYDKITDTYTFNIEGNYDHLANKGTVLKNIKANTDYKIVFEVLDNTLSESIAINTYNTIFYGNLIGNILAGQTGTLIFNAQTREDIENVLYDVWFSHLNTITGTFKCKIMVTESENTPYEQYGAMPSRQFKSPTRNAGDNANVFDGELELGTLDASGNLVANANSVRSKNYNKIKANTTYTLSNNKNYTEAVYIYNASKEVVASFFDKTLQTFTTPSTAKYIKFRSSAGNAENDLNVKFKLQEGTIATPYSPYGCGNANFKITNGLESTDTNYQEQSFTFPLAEGQRLMKGDYLADDGIRHKRNQIIFNGKESWFFTSNCVYTNKIRNLVKKPTSNSEVVDIKCNIYLKDTLSNCYNNINNKRISINTEGFVYIYDTDFKSSDEWKTYLAEQYANGTPIAIEYDLAEEEIESYTEEQQEVRNKIKKAKSYLDTTHIFSTDEINPIFDAEALADIETYINNKLATTVAGGE